MDNSILDAQKVGQLFVVQYYTQMNKDPLQMYKFYQDSSSFVHGGSEMGQGDIVVGRQAIHSKIASMDLQQAHTKIRQVDSHTSIENSVGPSVVVQVTGELSIAGQPMRPFVQTFLLALESPKKYFIYNDIFRYQLYDDDIETDSELPQDPPLGDRPLSKEPRSPSVPDESRYHGNEQTLPLDIVSDKRSPVPMGSADIITTETGGPWSAPDQYEPQSNGLPEEAHVSLGEEPSYPMEDEENTTPPIETEVTTVGGSGEEERRGNKREGEVKTISSGVPSTWAARLSQNIKGGGSATIIHQQPSHYYSNKQPHSTGRGGGGSNNPLPQREPKPTKKVEHIPEKKPFVSNPTSSATITSGSSSPRMAPDSHQIFVGGLPPGTSESDLRDLFKQYGKVTEIRVNPKNFGFVVFDSEQAVRDVIAAKIESPLTIRDKRLNIEEKRQSAGKGGGMGMNQGFSTRKAPLRPSNRIPRRT